MPNEDKNNNPKKEDLQISGKGVFLTVVLVIILLLLFTKIVLPAMEKTDHSPSKLLEQDIAYCHFPVAMIRTSSSVG